MCERCEYLEQKIDDLKYYIKRLEASRDEAVLAYHETRRLLDCYIKLEADRLLYQSPPIPTTPEAVRKAEEELRIKPVRLPERLKAPPKIL